MQFEKAETWKDRMREYNIVLINQRSIGHLVSLQPAELSLRHTGCCAPLELSMLSVRDWLKLLC